MIEAFLVPEKTVATAKGDGPTIDLGPAATRVFLLTLAITDIIEQESLDVSIHTSADGTTFDPKPIAAFPQKFYRGEYPLLVDSRAARREFEPGKIARGSRLAPYLCNLTSNL
jgi:hypothetical protein